MDEITIKKITIKNFKSLYDVSFEPGKVNVFIGENGSGKTSILEAIGVLSSAMSDRINNNSLQRKGIRLSPSSLYKSKFRADKSEPKTINLSLEWNMNDTIYNYSTHLSVPTDDDSWKYVAESVKCNGKIIDGRSNRSHNHLDNKIGYFASSKNVDTIDYDKIFQYISRYSIYQPDTLTLRGSVIDPMQINPIGLNGGRLAEAINDLIVNDQKEIKFGSLYMEDVLEMINWASDIKIGKPKKKNLNPDVPSTQHIVEFTDRYLKDSSSFTGYDASEGALYVLFLLTLAMHSMTPKIFAIDSFDHALNPRLAKKVTETFCNLMLKENKTVFMTTHNPLVLDGLNLTNDDIRLFTTSRDKNGYIVVKRITVSESLLKNNQPLSRLWINGFIGGVPELL